MKRFIISALVILAAMTVTAQPREKILINNGWTFALGHAGDMEKDFTHGTEYFTYLTKAASTNHSHAPIMPGFDDSAWPVVSLPHDWVVDLPYSGEASHSHGYKCVGWRYPENSVGWYRKHLEIPESDRGRRISILFEGIFRNSELFCNGFYLGHEVSGYASTEYDITEYVNFGGDNIITVRADASTEEGWYYEGAGIYRNVYMVKTEPVFVKMYGMKAIVSVDGKDAKIDVTASIQSRLKDKYAEVTVIERLCDASGAVVASSEAGAPSVLVPYGDAVVCRNLSLKGARLWSLSDPYLYTLHTLVYDADGTLMDDYPTRIGLRSIKFDPNEGFFLNDEHVKLKGFDVHLDHAGVGTGIPDELWRYRINRLKSLGANAIRLSHNPGSPAMLDLCDEMGMLVIDENRLMGINEEHFSLFRRMIERDINHPSIILWSIGNEEWAIESSPRGRDIAQRMCACAHPVDPARLCTEGNSGGPELVKGVDVFGYNYIIQNNVEENHRDFPLKAALGCEETTGSGTRGKTVTVPEKGWMESLNRTGVPGSPRIGDKDSVVYNVIERGWKYYDERPWLAGVFFWTGFDYRGEPNPMVWPATGSQFGVLDYCGFEKPEAEYLRSVWTSDDSVKAKKGRKGGREKAPKKKTVTSGMPQCMGLAASKYQLAADGQDVTIIDISVQADETPLSIEIDGPVELLGWGNGDPGFKAEERPVDRTVRNYSIESFSGKAQIILRSVAGDAGGATITISAPEIVGALPQHLHLETR